MNKKSVLTLLSVLIFPGCAQVNLMDNHEDALTVTLHKKQVGTYYAVFNIDGIGKTEAMVDTGAKYSTINEVVLFELIKQKKIKYISELTGIMADGTEIEIPLYSISIQIGVCALKDVEVAVFPNDTRMLLGLSALSRFPTFKFDMENLILVFPYCPN